MIVQADAKTISRSELLAAISRRSPSHAPGEALGQTIGELDWACEVLHDGQELPDEFYRA